MKISQVVKSCFHRSGGDISSFGQLHTKEHHAEKSVHCDSPCHGNLHSSEELPEIWTGKNRKAHGFVVIVVFPSQN